MGTKGVCVDRKCDVCGEVYAASLRRLERGWDKCCSKSCANRIRVIPKRRQVEGGYTKLDARTALKRMVRASTGGLCSICKMTPEKNGRQMDVHRVVPDGLGGKYEPGNLIPLCRSCHALEDRKTLG